MPTTGHGDEHTFASVAGELEDSRVLADTLVALTTQIATALDCSECCIYEYLPGRAAVRAQAIWAEKLEARDREWIGRTTPIAEIADFQPVIEKREIVVSYRDEPERTGSTDPADMAYWGERAALWAPIVSEGTVLGILELTEKRVRREFLPEEIELVRRMTDLAALALRNAADSRAAAARNRQLTALFDSSRAMNSTLDLDEVLDIVCRQTARALDAQSSYIYEFDPDADAMIWLAHYQRDPDHQFEEPLGTVYPIQDLPQDLAVVKTRRPVEVRLDDPALDPIVREQLVDWEELSSLMVPLVVGEDLVGALEVSEAAYVRHFTAEEIALCQALGEQAAAAIRNAQLYRQLQDQKAIIERQATTDGLTGLYNHRHFFERLRAEVVRARRYGFCLSVLMLDLDDFKSVNDKFGHPAGDRVLSFVGELLRGEVREDVDVPARYGGEEFAVILPHTGCETDGADPREAGWGARVSAERIREALASADLDLGAELPQRAGERTGAAHTARVTASIGVATFPAHAVDADELVSKADEALYRAKQQGKDRVAVFVRD